MKLWLAALLICVPTFADELMVPTPAETDTAMVEDIHSNIVLGMGPGIVLGDEKTRPGIALELAGRVSEKAPLYAGLEWGTFFELNGDSTAIFAILPSFFTVLDASESVHPLLGISVGPLLSTGTENDVRLAALLKPGVSFTVSDSISVEFQSKFGLLGTNFVFIPTLGTVFSI